MNSEDCQLFVTAPAGRVDSIAAEKVIHDILHAFHRFHLIKDLVDLRAGFRIGGRFGRIVSRRAHIIVASVSVFLHAASRVENDHTVTETLIDFAEWILEIRMSGSGDIENDSQFIRFDFQTGEAAAHATFAAAAGTGAVTATDAIAAGHGGIEAVAEAHFAHGRGNVPAGGGSGERADGAGLHVIGGAAFFAGLRFVEFGGLLGFRDGLFGFGENPFFVTDENIGGLGIFEEDDAAEEGEDDDMEDEGGCEKAVVPEFLAELGEVLFEGHDGEGWVARGLIGVSACVFPNLAKSCKFVNPAPSLTHPMLHDTRAWQDFSTGLINSAPGHLARLRQAADDALQVGRITIVDKQRLPPSGDPHDYHSIGIYWWPDPNSPDGLPYIRRDGEPNPERTEYDAAVLGRFSDLVSTLILAWLATGNSSYADHAAKLIRAWFLESETRMHPHLTYAQAIPGKCTGRGIGIIDTTPFCILLDLIGHLPISKEWTPENRSDLQNWFSKYLDWLLTSEYGKDECGENNNHGTWYDAQIACFANFCDRPELARTQIENWTLERIDKQLAPDASQPHELARTLSLSYCTYNLTAFACLARIAEQHGMDLWNYTKNGPTLLQALDWMLPFYRRDKEWTGKQILPFQFRAAGLLLNLAWQTTNLDRFRETLASVTDDPVARMRLDKNDLRSTAAPSSKLVQAT